MLPTDPGTGIRRTLGSYFWHRLRFMLTDFESVMSSWWGERESSSGEAAVEPCATGPLASSCSSTANCSSLSSERQRRRPSGGQGSRPVLGPGPAPALHRPDAHPQVVRDDHVPVALGEPHGRFHPQLLAERPPVTYLHSCHTSRSLTSCAVLIAALAHDTVLPEPRARTLARAFGYFWLGELDAAACVALPQVEQILRQLLRPRAPIVSVAQGKTPGTVDQLGGLIRSMPADGYPVDWSRALELLLVDPDRGMNLRNDVCHGLIDTPPKHRVALMLQAALYLLSHGHRTPAPLAQPAP